MPCGFEFQDCEALSVYQPHFADYLGRLERYTGLSAETSVVTSVAGKHRPQYGRYAKQVCQLVRIDGLGMRLYTETRLDANDPQRHVWLVVDGYYVELTPGSTHEAERKYPLLWRRIEANLGKMCGDALSMATRRYVQRTDPEAA